MKILADESVDWPIVVRLRDDGHDVLPVVETCPGAPDETVLALATAHQAVLLTADRDFGELVYRVGHLSGGIVLIRLAGLDRQSKVTLVSRVFANHSDELLDAFTVIAPGAARIRPRST